MEMAALSANPPVPPSEFLEEVSTGLALTASQSDLVGQQAAAGEAASEALNGTASAGYLAYLAGDSFQIGGKGLQIMTVVSTITNAETVGTVTAKPGTMAAYRAMSREERAAWKLNNPDAYKELMSNTSKGATDVSKTVTTTTETTTDTTKAATKVTQTTTTVLEAADTLEAVGRIASVAGIVGEAAAIIIQTATTATQYAEQAAYNDAFSAAVTKATKPLGVSDLKTMMSTGEAMTYLMAAMAGGNPNAIDSTKILTAKPDMPLSQILAIEKNF